MRAPAGAADVIVVRTLGAPLKLDWRSGRRRRPKRAERGGDAPDAVMVRRVTVIRGEPLEQAAARDWLAGCRDPETAALEVAEALRLLNRAIHAHRLSAGDPYVSDVSRARALRARIGYGSGDELVEGHWREAYDVPPVPVRGGRRRMLAPQEQVARILGGRRPTYPSEDLLLRARLDLDQGRSREAALQAGAAHAAFEAELGHEEAAEKARASLRDHGEPLSGLVEVALERDLDESQRARLEKAIAEMERFARRRRHAIADD